VNAAAAASKSSAAPIDAVYLLGLPHSGTTLLSRLLGEFDGCLAVGELSLFWRAWLTSGSRCGCGRPLRECPFWREVVAAGALKSVDVRHVAEAIHGLILARRLPGALLGATGRGRDAGAVSRCREGIARLYGALAEVAEGRTLIDSSKAPTVAMLLEGIPQISLRLVHLVRDSRGNAHSRFRSHRPGADMPFHSKLLLWDLWHLLAELRWGGDHRYLRVRYEDLIAAPAATLERILAFAGAAASGSPLRSEDLAALGPHHTVAGNQNRFRTGEVRLRLDSRWRRELAPGDRALALALTGPLLLRHGYLTHAPSGLR
jgi:hypothetical protein